MKQYSFIASVQL